MPLKNNEPTMLEKLENAIRSRKIKRFTEESYRWFRQKTTNMSRSGSRKSILFDALETGMTRTRPTIGRMYTFLYDAVTKDKLPYWDAMPLIFMVDAAPKGFYGINLHYLPPKARAFLFDALISEVANKPNLNERTKIELSYQILKSAQRYKMFKPCFKRYLNKGVLSRLVLVEAKHWEAALFLPIADWQKGVAPSKIWKDSLESIEGK